MDPSSSISHTFTSGGWSVQNSSFPTYIENFSDSLLSLNQGLLKPSESPAPQGHLKVLKQILHQTPTELQGSLRDFLLQTDPLQDNMTLAKSLGVIIASLPDFGLESIFYDSCFNLSTNLHMYNSLASKFVLTKGKYITGSKEATSRDSHY